MKKYRIILFTLIISIFCFILSYSVRAHETSNLYLDYSKITYQDSYIIKPSELVETMIGDEITENEKKYLNDNFESLKYNNKIPTSFVNTNMVDNKLDVHAQEYSYVDNYDRLITWIPYKAKINDQEVLFVNVGGIYQCELDVTNENEEINIEYLAHIEVLKDSANTLINAAYNAVNDYVLSGEKETEEANYQNALNEYNAYLEALNQYNQDYDDYLLYLEQKEAYDNYLVELEKYNTENEAYQNYLVEKENYPTKLLAYQNYLIALENYNANNADALEAYRVYQEKMKSVNHQLYIMDLLKVNMTSLNRNIHDAVMGSTVTEVLNRKSELVQLGVKEETIDRAYVATVTLRSIFTDYFALETEQERYTYYCMNYYTIKRNIEELCRTLDKLYRSGATVTALDVTGNNEKYIILVAQLALLSILLETDVVYNYEAWNPKTNKGNLKINGALVIDFNWTINGKNINTILEGVSYVDDITISPLPLQAGYPSPVTIPTPPTPVEEPVYPSPVAEPVKPTEVLAPTSQVTSQPTRPSEVIEPSLYVVPSDMENLLEVYKTSLNQRDEFDTNYDLQVKTNFQKKFKNASELVVEFYNTNGEFIIKYNVNNGSYIVYDNVIPTKEKDAKYTYQFSGWEYEDHEALDLNHVTKEGFVYPKFDNILNEYQVTWIVNDEEIIETYYYGDEPVYKGALIKANSIDAIYQFERWDKEIETVTKDFKYQAIFKETVLENNTLTLNDGDIKDILDNITDSDGISLVIQNDNNKIIVSSRMIAKLKANGAKEIKLDVTKNNDIYEIVVMIDNEINENDYQFIVNIDGEFDEIHSNLYQIKDDEKEKIRFEIKENTLSFTVNANYRYQFYSLYSINILGNEMIEFSVDKNITLANDLVTINIDDVTNGIRIDKVYVIDSLKQEVALIANDSNFQFHMPYDDVYIGIAYSYIDYKVTFISDDIVIMESTYHYGDEVIVPSTPKKASDESYSYEFIGWSPEVTDVNDDATYVAIFDRQEIQIEPIENRISVILILKIALVGGLSCACIGLVIALTTNKKAKKI